MVGTLQPLSSYFSICDEKGLPTDYFIRWCQQRQIDIGEGITAAQAQVLIDAALTTHKVQAGTGIALTPLDGELIHDPTISLNAVLNDLNDVDTVTTPPTNGQVLLYDAPSSLWKPGTVASGGGSLQFLAQVQGNGTSNVLSISNIPQTYEDLYIVVEGSSTSAIGAGTAGCALTVNGLTTSIYSVQRTYGNSTNTNSDNLDRSTSTAGYLASMSGTSIANDRGFNIVELLDYANTSNNKSFTFRGRQARANNYTSYNIWGVGDIETTAAITRVDFTIASGNWAIGSRLIVYGRGGTPTLYGTPFEVTATGTGSSQNITLPTTGLTTASVLVFCNGIRFSDSEYSISGTTLTMTSNASGDVVTVTGFMP